MSNRLQLHNLLLSIVGPNVYYQVPSGMSINYPCVKYSRSDIENVHANDSVYTQNTKYMLIVMSKNADEEIIDEISKLPKCSLDRSYIQDNIYHTVFNIYY